MNAENREVVKAAINIAAGELESKLPWSAQHPAGRNPYAHISSILRKLLGHSYTECNNKDVPAILDLINKIKENPF